MAKLTNKIAIVTGASRGLGRAIALAYAAEGAGLAVCSRNGEALATVAAELRAGGARVMAVTADVSRAEEVQAFCQRVIAAYGRVDVLVNNAGVAAFRGPVLETPREAWDQMLAVNVTGAFLCAREAVKRMSTRHGGLTGSPLLEHLPLLMQDVEDFDRDAAGLDDRARLIYEEIETRIASTTNRSLSLLTGLSALLLPPTLVSGMFGMNVGGIPWATEKEGFWIVAACIVAAIMFSYVVLKRLKIFP